MLQMLQEIEEIRLQKPSDSQADDLVDKVRYVKRAGVDTYLFLNGDKVMIEPSVVITRQDPVGQRWRSSKNKASFVMLLKMMVMIIMRTMMPKMALIAKMRVIMRMMRMVLTIKLLQ